MRASRWLTTAILGLLLSGCATIHTEAPSEARAALAPTGKLRVGLAQGNPIHVIRDPVSQEMKGVAFELGKELARRMGVPFEPVLYPSTGALLDATKAGQWDVAFFLVSPARMKDVDFTAALIELELGYLVPKGSPLSTSADVDRPGIRIAAQAKSQVDVILSGLLKQAVIVRTPGVAASIELVKSGRADAFAANKPTLFEASAQLPGSRVLEGRFAAERVAMAIPKGRDAGVAYARKFIEDAKSEGLVKTSVERAGVRGAVIAPPQ